MEFWKTHIYQCSKFNGTKADYCRKQKISIDTLRKWKQRLEKEDSKAFTDTHSPFLKLKIQNLPFEKTESETPHKFQNNDLFLNLPDPIWVGYFLASFISQSKK